MLFLVALTAAALAGLGQAWSTAAQREKERELEFRGRAIAAAIASYQRAGRSGPGELPRSLDDLLEDRRDVIVRHHLRKRYVDPFTGEADWELIPAPGDASRFYGVRSRSTSLLLRQAQPGVSPVQKACDRKFLAPMFGMPLADISPHT
ncbi:hypothetical protein LXT12_07420 [Pelomonas sp. P7]|uniref:Type II secretion system protein n=1 Tax=Pelomonas caseinilytica TaxID=2906763 RepID=A0ABS8XE16_9BURK|nr:hypothetical protein [Pelomonas sp. P7]MCE4537076.1 hypothetical protein [Pelomonas sp. P7]